MPTVPAKPPTADAHQAATGSPWEDYLTGKKMPAGRLLAKMEAARAKGGITIPDDAMRNRFAEALTAKPDRVARLVVLLQACASCSETVCRIVVDFADAGIKKLGIVAFPEPLDAASFGKAVSSWLDGIGKKPLKPAELNYLFLLLQFGWHRQWLDHDTAFRLVASAVSRSRKQRSKQVTVEKAALTPLEVLLTATPSAPVLTALLAHSQAAGTEKVELDAQIESQAAEIARLNAECARLDAIIVDLRAEITTLKDEKTASESKVVGLEKQIVDIRDGYQHKLDELRGRIRGILQGQLARWIETALDASRSDPPWTQAIQERLEDALKLIEKEMQWLQPSA